jgi:hypothetical protein
MYLVGASDDTEDIRRVALERPPLGPGYDEASLRDVVRLEVLGDVSRRSGPGWGRLPAVRADGTKLTRRVDGY